MTRLERIKSYRDHGFSFQAAVDLAVGEEKHEAVQELMRREVEALESIARSLDALSYNVGSHVPNR